MEILFECTTNHTKDHLRELAARLMRTKLIIHAVILVGIAVGFGAFVFLRGIENAYSYVLIFGGACVGLAMFRFDNTPKKYAERTYDGNMQMYHNEAQYILRADAVSVTTQNTVTGIVHRYEWEDCIKVLESKNLLIIKTRKENVIFLEKAGFSRGTPENFVQMIQEKRQVYLKKDD